MATTPSLSLKNLLVPSKAAEVEYPGMPGFKINVAFLSRETLVSIRKKATTTTFKGGSRQPTEELNDKLFLELYVNASIKGWTGLKLSYVEQLAPVNLSDSDLNSELPYTPEDALDLMKASSSFDGFITETVTDLSNFTQSSTKP